MDNEELQAFKTLPRGEYYAWVASRTARKVADGELSELDAYGSQTVIRRTFSWQEWVNTAKAQGVSKSSGAKNAEWSGATFDGAVEMALGAGYVDSLPMVDAYLSSLEMDLEEATHNSFELTFDVSGSDVEVSRFLSGEPECMMDSLPIKTMRTGRVLKVAVPVCYSATVPAETVLRRGVAIMAMVEAFGRRGHPMEIWAVMAIHGGGRKKRLVYSIKVQDGDQPLDMGRVMYALAHPSMLRQLCFSVEDTENTTTQRTFNIGGSYGHASYAVRHEDMEPIAIENCIVLPELDYANQRLWDSEDDTVKWIVDQLGRIDANS